MISLFLAAFSLLCVLTNAFSDKKIKENIVNSMYVKDLDNFTCTNESLYINKNEIFKYYTTTVLYGYDDYLSVYRDIYDKKISLAKLFDNFDEARGDRFYGVLFENKLSNEHQWVRIKKDSISTTKEEIFPAEPLSFDLYSYISSDKIWNQLKSSSLDLQNTEMMVIDRFFSYFVQLCFLLYDGEHEYYLSPYELFYDIEEFEISKYINPADRHKKWIAADQLVSIEDDLIPFLFNEEQILVKALATKRTEWD